MTKVAVDEIAKVDPCEFVAPVDRKVVHSGCCQSIDALLARAPIGRADRADGSCGVRTTAIEIARQSGAFVTAANVSELTLSRAAANVADITYLGYILGAREKSS